MEMDKCKRARFEKKKQLITEACISLEKYISSDRTQKHAYHGNDWNKCFMYTEEEGGRDWMDVIKVSELDYGGQNI